MTDVQAAQSADAGMGTMIVFHAARLTRYIQLGGRMRAITVLLGVVACSTDPDPHLDDVAADQPLVITPTWHNGRVTCSDTAEVVIELEGEQHMVQVFVADLDGLWIHNPDWKIDPALNLLRVPCLPGDDLRIRYLDVSPPRPD